MCEIKNIISNKAVLKNQEYSDRLEKELYYINELNQVDNILQAYEVKQIIESFNVPFFIRGSAGGSLVLFLLGFTSVDPVKNNILFERFINEHRDVLGDIDFDLPRSMRNTIMQKVFQTFLKKGKRLGRLCTRIFYRENSAIREILRRHKIRTTLPKWILKDAQKLKSYLTRHSVDYDDIVKEAKELEGELRYCAAHVGGIISVYDDEKWIIKSDVRSRQIPIVNLDKNDVDKQKRFKIDLLSNSGLDILKEVYGCIELNDVNFPSDQKVFDMIGSGDVIGLIYGESPLVKSTFKIYHEKKKITSVEDIARCISLIRPMGRGNGRDSDLIFDDDWIRELAKLLDIDYGEADKERRKLAKDDVHILSKLKTIVSPGRLKQLMQIKQYGFCKAHAMNYAQLIYCQAYAKFYKPVEFYCAVLNNLNGRIYANWVYYLDLLKHNVKIFCTEGHRGDVFVVKTDKVQGKYLCPKRGIQQRLFPMNIEQELSAFGGFTTLKEIDKLNGLTACSRYWNDTTFRTMLKNGELIDEVSFYKNL